MPASRGRVRGHRGQRRLLHPPGRPPPGSGGRVIAFEPNPDSLKVLLLNTLPEGDTIRVYPFAVSDREGFLSLMRIVSIASSKPVAEAELRYPSDVVLTYAVRLDDVAARRGTDRRPQVRHRRARLPGDPGRARHAGPHPPGGVRRVQPWHAPVLQRGRAHRLPAALHRPRLPDHRPAPSSRSHPVRPGRRARDVRAGRRGHDQVDLMLTPPARAVVQGALELGRARSRGSCAESRLETTGSPE